MDQEHTEMDHQDTPPPEATSSATSGHESVGETDSDHTRDSVCHTPEGLTPRNTLGIDTPGQGTPNRNPVALDRNPEPSAELLSHNELIEADKIGNTVFSKHWLISTLMKLIKVVDSQNENKDASGETEAGLDIDESLQDQLCQLWDMSMNSEVVAFLLEYQAVEILTGVISQSKAPRATEICAGILGNMACTEEACKVISSSHKLIKLMLLMLADPDTPTLVETTRLLTVCVSNPTTRSDWLSVIGDDEEIYNNITFILKSSTNGDLLRNTGNLVDKLFDVDDELCKSWSKPDFIQALLEAIKQVGPHPGEELDTYVHIMEIISTSQSGVEALLSYSKEISGVLIRYLMFTCSEEIVGLVGHETSLASVLAVLNALLSSVDCAHALIIEDCQLMRCTLKILNIVYPNLMPQSPATKRIEADPMRRKRAKSHTKTSPTHSAFHSEETTKLDCNAKTPERLETSMEKQTSKKTTQNGSRSKDDSDNKHEKDFDKYEEEEEGQSVYDEEMLRMLYEIIQALLVDVLTIIEKVESPIDNSSDPANDEDDMCSTLDYLDDACPRDRIYYLLEAAQTHSKNSESKVAPDQGQGDSTQVGQGQCEGHSERWLNLLMNLSQKYELTRLQRIMRDVVPSE